MSTATKLTYLNDTKGLLKDSINSLGGEITSQTTFRQYATELDSIYSKLPKVSGTGSNVTLTPTLKGRLSSVINGDTEQDGTPTPDNPKEIKSVTGLQKVTISGGTGTTPQEYEINLGKNLFTAGISQTVNTGVTANYNESEIKLNGTTSGDGNIFYDSTLGTFNNYRKIGNFKAGNYTIKFNKKSGSLVKNNGGSTALYIRNSNNQQIATLNITEYTESTNSTITIEQDTTLYVQYYVNKAGIQYTDYIFTLQLEKGSQATSYSPYFTPIHLYEGDQIIGTPYNWSIKHVMGEIVLDGSESGYQLNGQTTNYNQFGKYIDGKAFGVNNFKSNIFNVQSPATQVYQIAGRSGNTFVSFNLAPTDCEYSQTGLKNWITQHNIKLVYELATETTESITNTELIEDLNNLYYAKSYNGATNITITSEDLKLIMTASAIKGE